MKVSLMTSGREHRELMKHLLPTHTQREQAAFLYAQARHSRDEVRFDVIETRKLATDDFAVQLRDHFELCDKSRAEVIKRAHDLRASLVEIHSHTGPWPAEFSISDRMGLRETVPHMWWRLEERPYIALVVTKTEFDALVWLDDPKVPRDLDAWRVDTRMFFPTNNSLRGWR